MDVSIRISLKLLFILFPNLFYCEIPFILGMMDFVEFSLCFKSSFTGCVIVNVLLYPFLCKNLCLLCAMDSFVIFHCFVGSYLFCI